MWDNAGTSPFYDDVTFTSSYLMVDCGLTNLRPFSFTCKHTQIAKTGSGEIQLDFKKAVKKHILRTHQNVALS